MTALDLAIQPTLSRVHRLSDFQAGTLWRLKFSAILVFDAPMKQVKIYL
jgi:hypothetical protein